MKISLKHLLLSLILILGFTACDDDDDALDGAVGIPAGTFSTECVEDNGEGEIVSLIFSASGSVQRVVEVYSTTDCTGEPVVNDEGDFEINLADEEIAPNMSYIQIEFDQGTGYAPYHYSDGVLSVGEPVQSIDPDPETVFADFIADYQQHSEDVFTQQ